MTHLSMHTQAREIQADAASTAAAAAADVGVWTSSSRDALHFHFCDKDKVRTQLRFAWAAICYFERGFHISVLGLVNFVIVYTLTRLIP